MRHAHGSILSQGIAARGAQFDFGFCRKYNRMCLAGFPQRVAGLQKMQTAVRLYDTISFFRCARNYAEEAQTGPTENCSVAR
jgi:hypothetical protein